MTDIRATDHLSTGETPQSADAAAHRSDDESGVGKLAELLKGAHTVMFTTVDDDGTLVSRPMAVQDTEFDGDLWLFALKDSAKVDQIRADAHVGVTYMSNDSWISIDGHAELVDDRQRIHDYWNPFVQAWFTGGPDDPNVTLIKVVGEQAEWWETSGNRLTSTLKMLRSAVTHKPATDVGDNEKVEL
jgi:general stress protein 26